MRLKFIYESVNNINLPCWHEFVTFNCSVHSHEIRQSHRGDIIIVQKYSFQYGLKSIRYLGA